MPSVDLTWRLTHNRKATCDTKEHLQPKFPCIVCFFWNTSTRKISRFGFFVPCNVKFYFTKAWNIYQTGKKHSFLKNMLQQLGPSCWQKEPTLLVQMCVIVDWWKWMRKVRAMLLLLLDGNVDLTIFINKVRGNFSLTFVCKIDNIQLHIT